MKENIDIISVIAEKVAEALIAKQEPIVENSCKMQYFSVAEVCSMLKISKATFYRHKNLGYIKPAVHVGRKPLFSEQSVADYLHHFY